MSVPYRYRRLLITIAALAVVALGAVLFVVLGPRSVEQAESPQESKPEAPPDLQKHRDDFAAGVAAAQQNDGATAVRRLSAFSFGSREVEEYRLYYLATGLRQTGNQAGARATLARLWQRKPNMVPSAEAGFSLGELHANAGAWRQAGDVYSAIASRSDNSAVAATARWQEIESRLVGGDAPAALRAARLIVIRSPRAPQADEALALIRGLSSLAPGAAIPMTPEERLERAVSLMRDGNPQSAYNELTALQSSAPASLRLPIQLNRGLALHHMRRYEDSNKVLEPLTGTFYKYAIPALYHAAKNYKVVSASIDPNVTKTIVEKKRVGTVKVRVGKGKKKKTVTKPKFANVSRTIKLVDLAKKNKKDEYSRLATERLKDLLQLPLANPVRLEVLEALIEIAEAKDQHDYVQELVAQVVTVDANADPGLQTLWDNGWGSYSRGDLATARKRFRFIADTYGNPNVRRQSEYWFARTVERQGEKDAAAAIYGKLASAPYSDLYALHSISRGAKRDAPNTNPLEQKREDWSEIAERQMPKELRLAYELTALSSLRDARLEIQKNMRRENERYAEALLSDIYHSTGNALLMYRSIRRAFPRLATVEQDSVPPYFVKMYYPLKYQETIRKNAAKQGIDPYLVMGLILQESYYNPSAKSRVNATGLMQIMPPTGAELARRARIPFATSRLENPDINVQLGTMHLKFLIDMFRGNTYLAVASYNAGQGNVLKWRRANPSRPIDEFLESIPFSETRNYVKRVTILRASYERLAG